MARNIVGGTDKKGICCGVVVWFDYVLEDIGNCVVDVDGVLVWTKLHQHFIVAIEKFTSNN